MTVQLLSLEVVLCQQTVFPVDALQLGRNHICKFYNLLHVQWDSSHSVGYFDPEFELYDRGQRPGFTSGSEKCATSRLVKGILSANIPSEKLLIASIFLCCARYANVTSGDPSLTIKWTVIRLLNTTVHVESRSRCCNDRNTSATPCSPEWVAIKICSMYLVFGGAA